MTTIEGSSVREPIVGCGAGTGSSVVIAGHPLQLVLAEPEVAAIVEATRHATAVEV